MGGWLAVGHHALLAVEGDTGDSRLEAVEVCGGVWRCMEVYGGVWWCMVVYGSVWRFVEVCGGVWKCVGLCGGVWRCWRCVGDLNISCEAGSSTLGEAGAEGKTVVKVLRCGDTSSSASRDCDWVNSLGRESLVPRLQTVQIALETRELRLQARSQ